MHCFLPQRHRGHRENWQRIKTDVTDKYCCLTQVKLLNLRLNNFIICNGHKDLYAEIERNYKIVFPERSFAGPVLRENIDDIFSEPWFYLHDSKNQYEISEMSGGERAIFPMLMDFASWNIYNSVILIDEIELHLHPPMQQATGKSATTSTNTAKHTK